MEEIIVDIKKKLEKDFYTNEEHVRLSIVARLLLELDWDIWNPLEVNSEFKAVPNEDHTKVDLALFVNKYMPPSVFIEIKSVGKIDTDLLRIEQQLRDYNRNNTAQFSIITDGRKWRFYYSQTGGEFSHKCFKTVNISSDDINEIVESFKQFLSKEEILNNNSKNEAERLLQLNQKQRALEDALPKARRLISEPPFPSLLESLRSEVLKLGFDISFEEAKNFAEKNIDKKPIRTDTEAKYPSVKNTNKKTTISNKDFPPTGTKCKFSYKGETFYGKIINKQLVVSDYGEFNSFSAASVAISNTSRNGWHDWELLLPNANNWILADTWRKSG